MADTYETKKINELSEATSAENSDLMMVGNPTSGQTSKITKENLMKDINTSLTQATNDIAENKTAIEQNASDITEINSALAEKSNALVVNSFVLSGLTVSSENYASGNISCSTSGYTAIGVVGFYISNGTSGSGSSRCFVTTMRLSDSTTINYQLGNRTSSDAVVQLTVYVLFVANEGTTISPQGYPDDDNPDSPTVDDPEGTPTPQDD